MEGCQHVQVFRRFWGFKDAMPTSPECMMALNGMLYHQAASSLLATKVVVANCDDDHLAGNAYAIALEEQVIFVSVFCCLSLGS